jgi:hypothetical protein
MAMRKDESENDKGLASMANLKKNLRNARCARITCEHSWEQKNGIA